MSCVIECEWLPCYTTYCSFQISENSTNNTVVGTLTVTDPDNEFISRQSFQCLVVNQDPEPFMVRQRRQSRNDA